MSEARATALPGRSRHGFYAGQVSHLDQVGPAHGAVHTDPPIPSDRPDEARLAQAVQPSVGHFDERYGTGGRYVPRQAESAAPEEVVALAAPPEPAPEPVRSPAITPEMVFWFGPKDPDPVAVAPPPPAEPQSAPPLPAGSPEPDPVSRSFGTWEEPPAPTARPDFVVAAQQALDARAVEAANYATSDVDLTTVRDLFPEPRLDAPASDQPETPVAATMGPAPSERAAPVGQGQERVDGAVRQEADEPRVAPPIVAATATGPEDAGLGSGTTQAEPGNGAADTGGEAAAVAPPTKQSRYWATGAHASAFVGAWMGGIPAFVGPLVVWLARKDNDPFAAEHGRNALNFNLSVIVYVLGLIIVSIITFGIGLLVTIPGFIVLGLAWFAFTLVGTIKAASSENYTYPLTIRFVR